MTQEPDLFPSSGHATDELPPPPHYLKAFAISNIVIGAVLAYLNFKTVSNTNWALGRNIPDKVFSALLLNMLVYAGVGLFFVLGGSLLPFRVKAGRFLSLLAAVLCFVGYLVSSVNAAITAASMNSGEIRSTRMGSPAFEFGGSWSLWAATMFYAIFVIVITLLPGVCRWVKGR